MTQDFRKYTRRDALAAISAGVVLTGCGGKNVEPAAAPTSVSDVPLRVLWVGEENDVDAVTRAWRAVMSQPLKMNVVPLDRSNPGGLLDAIASRVKKNDLLVVPTLAITSLMDSDSITPLNKDEVRATSESLGRLFQSVRNGATVHDGETVGFPIGAKMPALLTVDEAGPLASWQDYHQWVQDDLNGEAAEPLSAGWAGMMYLWRAASSVKEAWLFGPSRVLPVINTQPYIDVLAQMLATKKIYKGDRKSPQQIWTQLKTSKLRGGIGFPVENVDGEVEVNTSNLPGGPVQNRVVVDCFAPVVALSAGCRQSDASKQFMNWLSGGDGSEPLRGQVPRLTVTRSAIGSSQDSRKQSGSGYDQWLTNRLSNSPQLSTLNIGGADQHYAVLDTQIGDCLDGKTEPAAALENVARAWGKLQQEAGKER